MSGGGALMDLSGLEVEISSRCSCPGKLCLRSVAGPKKLGRLAAASSKRVRTTVFGSWGSTMRPESET